MSEYPKKVRDFLGRECERVYLLEYKDLSKGRCAYIAKYGKVFFRYRPFADPWGDSDLDFADNGTFESFKDFCDYITRQEEESTIQHKDGLIHLTKDQKYKTGVL